MNNKIIIDKIAVKSFLIIVSIFICFFLYPSSTKAWVTGLTFFNRGLHLLAGKPGGTGYLDGTGAEARFGGLQGVAVDSSGNVFIADTDNNVIRKITPVGVVTTFAGTIGVAGTNDGTGTSAKFNLPSSLAIDSSDNIYVADTFNNAVRKITPAGVVTTFAGDIGILGSNNGTGTAARFGLPRGIAVDGGGNIYVSDTYNCTIRKITSLKVVTTLAGSAGLCSYLDNPTGSSARFDSPMGIGVDGSGTIYVLDNGMSTVRKVTPAGAVTTLAGLPGTSGTADGNGTSARFNNPRGLTVSPAGDIYVAETVSSTIRKVTATGDVTTIAGVANSAGAVDATGSSARFNTPYGIASDSSNLYIADTGNFTVRKISAGAVVSTLAGASINLGSTNGVGRNALFNSPSGITADLSGNTYAIDASNNTIRKVSSSGVVSTFAGTAGVSGSADGTGASASFTYLTTITSDTAGNIYVADNSTIRKITPGAVVTTMAGTPGAYGNLDGTGSAANFSTVFGLAVDSSGNVFASDSDNHSIRKITPGGVVTTVAGNGSLGSSDGNGASAGFNFPEGLAVDSSNNIYIADSGNNTIRKMTPTFDVTTIGGSAGQAGSVDGTGTNARFNVPVGITSTGNGTLYVADVYNSTIRKITPAGVVSTVVGKLNQRGFKLGALPAIVNAADSLVIRGNKLYIASSKENIILWCLNP